MKITENKVVSLTYTLKLDNEEGEIVEQLASDKPLKFLFGSQQLLPKFEENIKGLGTGASFAFTLNPNVAYGEINKDAIISLSKNVFIVDGVLRDDLLQIGNIIPMRDHNGMPLNGKVIEVGEEEILLDFNHPMAGKTLYFEGEVVEIAEATEQEIEQGYPEGMGGGGGCGGGCSCGSGGCESEESECGSESGGCGSSCGCH
ncbi:MAG: FKBP-type peptidyl-prolyl cis-trans isomerase [Bacteroidales bacterium]|nr:FKBP-type peptidyl-prolyl cis-trans isomerase [Bacteroidales bacterium]